VKEIDQELKGDYFKRLFVALDGIWYIVVEKYFGLENAVQVDKEVWQVMAKISARETKHLLSLPHGKLESLSRSLAFRFAVEGYKINANRVNGSVLEIQMKGCPWRRQIMKSKNEKLLRKVAEQVCPVVYETWAAEFLDQFQFEMSPKICKGGEICRLRFVV
jgi:hypothetical protein